MQSPSKHLSFEVCACLMSSHLFLLLFSELLAPHSRVIISTTLQSLLLLLRVSGLILRYLIVCVVYGEGWDHVSVFSVYPVFLVLCVSLMCIVIVGMLISGFSILFH